MCIEMQELVFDPNKGRDVLQHFATLDYTPANYLNRESAAKGFHAALLTVVKRLDMDESALILQTPEESQAGGFGDNWRVIWEEGPFEWAIPLSFRITGPWGFTEPYYSFDLCFTY